MPFILQGNPQRFDIRTYMTQPVIYWYVNRYVTEFQLADQVLLWESGPNGGVVAYGVVDEVPTVRTQVTRPAALGDGLWRDTVPDPTSMVVGIRLLATVQQGLYVSRTAIKAEAGLADLDILRQPQATVFRCTREQLVRVLGLLGG